MIKKIHILFACTNNSCRSQMAEGLAKAIAGDSIEAYSAGTKPKSVNKLAVKVMKELGIDISKNRSKHIDNIELKKIDYIVTLCDSARNSCINLQSKKLKILHWDIIDPAVVQGGEEAVLHIFRNVRDELKKRVEGLIKKAGGTQLSLL